MGFKDLVGKAQELSNAAADTASKALDEFNEALPTMRALGFTIRDFHMGMGIIPEIGAKLVASVDTVDVKRIEELIAHHKEEKLLVTVLKALQAAYHVKEQFGTAGFKTVVLDLKLGIPPQIGVGFGSAAVTSEVIASAAHS